jgi:hypothetical protein
VYAQDPKSPTADRAPPATRAAPIELARHRKAAAVAPDEAQVGEQAARFFLKLDPKTNPEMASTVDVLGCKFFFDLGYNAPENYMVKSARSELVANEKYSVQWFVYDN